MAPPIFYCNNPVVNNGYLTCNRPYEQTPVTLYWVGGAVGHTTDFNWAANWSASSGGGGGTQAPTVFTDLIFDSASTTNCALTANAACRSITSTSNFVRTFNTSIYSLNSQSSISFVGHGGLTFGGVVQLLSVMFML